MPHCPIISESEETLLSICDMGGNDSGDVPTMSTSSGCFQQFCQATSLHGWKFLTNEDEQANKRPLLKAGWIAVVFGSIGVAVFFLAHSFINFFGSTVMTTQDTTR